MGVNARPDEEAFMRLALEEAREARLRGDVPVGAVVVRGDVVLGRGSNRKTCDPTAHAELQAIRSAAERLGHWNLGDCDLYVTLEPCPMCAGACVNARLRRIVFGARDPRAGAAGSLFDIPRDSRLNHRCRVRHGVLAEECAALLRDYFLRRRGRQVS
ncbi:tRNA adenosine(34) deaminase TadA [Fretibacterium sp. OH1220_COT-178]|uniref:tRNA adenosine(34) deaminase TadA n=1 Tax=Fretibacterium sp. OH1220_COT-178 TaxID=2491047 RepID=UPI001F2FA7AE|nr:tRNA adenosine(34) deaminase TadA [Fretibacterium sp. OH1220_COT-178]